MRQKITRGAYLRIHSNYQNLLPAEKQIADYILKNEGDIDALTINQLAEVTDTSKATVTRFCQRLGYDGFKQFRLSAAKDQAAGETYLHEAVAKDDNPETIIQKICNSNASACADTALLLEAKNLEMAAKAILDSNKIFIFGDGAVSPIATDFYQKILRIGLPCFYSPDRRFQQMQSSLVGKGDVAISFDLSGSSKHTIQTTKIANYNDCQTISICNTLGSPLAKEATISLYASGKTNSSLTGTFGPRIALLCVVDCLFTLILQFSEGTFTERFKKTKEVILEDWIK